jgi:hypothetical protein
MITALDYAGESTVAVNDEASRLGLSVDLRRPVRFHARVQQQALLLRFALQALGQVVWSNEMWAQAIDPRSFLLDPIITVHPDRVFFEAFSNDQSTYGLVIADRELFETEGEVHCGTTNVDFTSWLWHALSDMRSSRPTWLHIGPAGFQVETEGGSSRLEKKVDVPDAWVRGFLQLQAAMALPGTRVTARPVDVLAAIRFLRTNKAKTSPRALRYEFEPGREVRMVLEPWQHEIPLQDSEHSYTQPRSVRTWGRRRLRLLEPILPHAESVEIYLKGRALPTFYAARMGGITFLLGLSDWSAQGWTGTGSFDLLFDDTAVPGKLLDRARKHLHRHYAVSVEELARKLDIPRAQASSLLLRLCRQGQVVYDVQRRQFRHRELFATPLDEDRYFPPDPRREKARQLIARGQVRLQGCQVQQMSKTRTVRSFTGTQTRETIYRDWKITGTAEPDLAVEIVVKDTGQILFGQCGCPFFREHLLNQGPCEHMMALAELSSSARGDLPMTTITEDSAPAFESEEEKS